MAVFGIEYRGEIKKDATPVINFNLSDTATSGDQTGVAAITVYYSKNGGAATNLVGPTFAEVSAANMPGVYRLTLTAAMTDTAGELLVYISTGSSYTAKLAYRIVDNIASDIYSRIGAPAGASVSADIAATYSRIGAPAAASVSADMASVYSRIGAPAAASVSADVANVYSRIGAPVGASISADIAVVDTVTDAVKVQTDKFLFDASNYVKSTPQSAVTAAVVTQAAKDAIAEAVWAVTSVRTPYRTQT